MSINFASSDFYQPDLKEKVFDALARAGLDAEWLEVELTESLALRDVNFAVAQMNKLRDLGVKLAMDDFGTGYSSLSHLQKLPITLLKLDQSFIKNIEHFFFVRNCDRHSGKSNFICKIKRFFYRS